MVCVSMMVFVKVEKSKLVSVTVRVVYSELTSLVDVADVTVLDVVDCFVIGAELDRELEV